MNFNFDMTKPYFDEIAHVSNEIKKVLKKNRDNPFVDEIRKSIQSNNDIISGFPVFFKKVLYPISYERHFKETKEYSGWSRDNYAVGKWFGSKNWKNISHLEDRRLIEGLKQDHINLIPDREKKKIAQEFFNFSRVFVGTDNKNSVDVSMNVSTTLYKLNWLQIRDMAKKRKNNNWGNDSINDDKDHINYIYPKESLPNSIVSKGVVEYNAKENTITLHFKCGKLEVEEILISPATINNSPEESDEDCSKGYLFLSERLFNWNDFDNAVDQKMHEMFIDNIEVLLTPEIKTAVRNFIKKQQEIKDSWTAIQMKYAKRIIQKGNI